jgi:hypothetical protein
MLGLRHMGALWRAAGPWMRFPVGGYFRQLESLSAHRRRHRAAAQADPNARRSCGGRQLSV